MEKNNNESLENIIIHEVFKLFYNENYTAAKNVLLGLYNENYKDIENLKTKRLLLSNLAWVEDELGDKKNAKKHIDEIKKAISGDTEYMLEDPEGYSHVLNLYCELFKDSISKEDYINQNNLIAKLARESGNTPNEAIALANVYCTTHEEAKIVSLIKRLLDSTDTKCKYCINTLLNELKDADKASYKEALNLIDGGVSND